MTSLNDPLFLHKNGVKTDYLSERKQAKMKQTIEKGNQYYPTDNTGVIDEWAALALQQDNYWNQKAEQDKVERRLRQKQYFDDLDWQRRAKAGEAEDKDKARKELEQKLKSVEDLEKQEQQAKAEALKREKQEMLKWAKMAQKRKEMEREREKAEYNSLLRKTEAKIQSKADALAEYYRQLDNQMKDNYDMHYKLAYSPLQDRLSKLQGIEAKNEQEFLRKQAHNDEHGHLNRLKNNQILIAENDKMLKKREYERELERMKKAEDDIHAKGEDNAFQIGQEANMEEMRMKKNLYKQTLLYQQAMNEHNKHNFGKMTYAEKRLNKHDLKAYREKKPQIYSLQAPGINNIDLVGSTQVKGKKGFGGEMGNMPLTTRYDANKTGLPNNPSLNRTYKGLSGSQSMANLDNGMSMRDSRLSNGPSRRESILQNSARNSLQL